jgi:hypothetical protein
MALAPPLPTDLYPDQPWLISFGEIGIPGVDTIFTAGHSVAATIEEIQWRLVTWKYTRATPSNTTEDTALWSLNVAKIQSGQLVPTWAAQDYTAVDNVLDALTTAVLSVSGVSHTLVEYAYHLRAFNPDLPIGQTVPVLIDQPDGTKKEVQRFSPTGPPLHVKPKNTPGTLTGVTLPYQVAMSVTLKTGARRHWGRVYLPGLSVAVEGSNPGRFDATRTQTVADAFSTAAKSLETAGFAVVVPATQAVQKYAAGLNGVVRFQVDDVPDTIRRRRAKQSAVRSVGA